MSSLSLPPPPAPCSWPMTYPLASGRSWWSASRPRLSPSHRARPPAQRHYRRAPTPPLAPRRRAQYPLHLCHWVAEASPPDCHTYVARIPPPPPFAPFPPLRAPSPTTTFAPPMTTLHVAAASALHHQRTASAHLSSLHCAPLDGANSTPTPVAGSLPTLDGTLSPWVAQQYKCGPLRLWSRPP
jgi:hypothetical protein